MVISMKTKSTVSVEDDRVHIDPETIGDFRYSLHLQFGRAYFTYLIRVSLAASRTT